jgi:uncharacterized protein (DUF1697 family)
MARSKSGTTKTAAHVALLRGINVGGRNKLPMKQLVPLFEQAGCKNVQTYIQSGNVIFRASDAVARRIPTVVAKAIADQFGYSIPVVVRDAKSLDRIANKNPFLAAGADPAMLHVAFLAARPSAAKLKDLDPHRSPPDEYTLSGSEIYLHCPKGFARTKLTNAYFDSKLDTTSTVRNWKTVLKLLELLDLPIPS